MNTVTEHKFVCLMDREVKQTEMSKSDTEKGLLQGQSRKMGGSNSSKGFSKLFFKINIILF